MQAKKVDIKYVCHKRYKIRAIKVDINCLCHKEFIPNLKTVDILVNLTN